MNFLIRLICLSLCSVTVLAQDRVPLSDSKQRYLAQQELALRIREKNYVGGADEGELKVQKQLAKPDGGGRIAPVVEEDHDQATTPYQSED